MAWQNPTVSPVHRVPIEPFAERQSIEVILQRFAADTQFGLRLARD